MIDMAMVQQNPNNGAGVVTRTEFDGTQIEKRAETASAAAAAQVVAEIQARQIVALQRPRDLDNVSVKLKKECNRPGFADTAWYRKPIGQGVEGFSIRFVEAAIRCMGNITIDVTPTYDDDEKRIIRVTVADLESNIPYSIGVVVDKTVERRKVQEGQEVISARTNSSGQTTYLVRANDDDLLNKQAALISKAIRTLGLRLLPGDIQDECKAIIKALRGKKIADDPDAARKALIEAFAAFNIMPSELKAYLGCDLAQANNEQIEELRGIYVAIRDSEATWAEVMANKARGGASEEGEEKAKVSPVVAKIREKARAKAAEGKAAKRAGKAPEAAAVAPSPPPSGPQHNEDGVLPEDPPLDREPGSDG